MLREHFTFSHQLRVRWAEVDRQDEAFNGHYFLYFDVAIAEYWRAIGFAYPREIVALGMDIYAIKACMTVFVILTAEQQRKAEGVR